MELNKEEIFHDRWAVSIKAEDVRVDESFEACTSPENRIILKKLGDIKNKKILDLGCGAGEAAVYFAKKGAFVSAVDISKGLLEIAEKTAERFGVSIDIRQSYSHELNFEDGFFDIVYAANLLHHVDIDRTLAQVHRVLRKNGVFVSWDPLAYNPAINIYRRISRQTRTEGEHPLKMSDLKIFRKYFSKIEIYTTWLFTLWIFVKFYFFDKINPNKIRYWKKILIGHKRLEGTYKNLEQLDRLFLKLFPFLKRYCWNIVVFGFKE